MTGEILFANISIVAGMLFYTSYLDLKKREVEDKIWIIFGLIGALLQIVEIEFGLTDPIQLLISIGLAALIGMGIFYFGFYGGADGKAIIVLAILLPIYRPFVGLYSLAPIIVLSNGILLSVLLPFFLLGLNISRIIEGKKIFEGFKEPLYRKVLACFLGYKAASRPRQFQFSMERKDTIEGEEIAASKNKKFDFGFMSDDFETTPGTWVTPGIPLLVFFTAGYFVLLFYGDLVIGLIQFLFKIV